MGEVWRGGPQMRASLLVVALVGAVVSTAGVAPVAAADPPRMWGQVTWSQLSSDAGDLEVPFGAGAEQTDAQILDVDNDGVNDFVVTNRSVAPAGVWYQRGATGWTRHVFDAGVVPLEAGGTHHDVDSDGDLDIVVGEGNHGNQIYWWENPYPTYDPATPWTRHVIKDTGPNKHHDVIFGDIDGDGADEFIFWNDEQTLNVAEIPDDPSAGTWPYEQIFADPDKNEGLAIADVNLDGVDDIVGAGRWFEYVGPGNWTTHTIDADMEFTRVAVDQIIPGGRPEILFVIGDVSGAIDGTSFLTMYEWDGAAWATSSLLPELTHAGHSLDIVDFNNDGLLDVFNAEMTLGGNADAAGRVYYGDGTGQFTVQEFSTGVEHHQSKVGDLDGDGDLDILGKPFTDDSPGINVWLNTEIDPGVFPLDQWVRHRVDGSQPWLASHALWGDFDLDGATDIVSGGWIYESQGGDYSLPWSRTLIGAPLNNVAFVHDFDGDGDLDLLGTDGLAQSPTHPGGTTLHWGRNEGDGTFTVLSNITPGVATDQSNAFVQGITPFDLGNDGALDIAISWNFGEHGQSGIDLLTVPADPSVGTWPLTTISSVSEGEELGLDDIDGDGDLDLFQGSGWLENDHPTWTRHESTALIGNNTPYDDPDRISMADVDADGDMDAIVGLLFESAGIPTDLVWLEHPQDPTQEWPLHVVASGIGGGFSMSVDDIDNDGDTDVVIGEHVGQTRMLIFENINDGASWVEYEVDDGTGEDIDHHDGALLVDFENDGDLDIVSLGWHNQKVWLYENKALEPGDISDVAPPTAPANVSANAYSSTRVDLVWQPSVDDRGIARYRILRDGVEVATATGVQFSDTGLDPETSYSYTVVAVDLSGNESPASAPATATTPTPDTSAPSEPVFATPVVSAQRVDLSWTPATDDRGVAAYWLLRDGEWVDVLPGDATTYADTALTPDTSYSYVILASDAEGNFSPPAQATAVTLPPPTGLWAAYGFEDAGPTVLDSSIYANNASVEPTAVLTPSGHTDQALETNGVAGHVDLDKLDIPTDGMTLMAWVRADDFGTYDARIVSKTTGSAADDHLWMLSTISGQRLRFRLKTDDGNPTTTLIGTGGSLTAGTWHHVAATYDGSTMRLFLDGTEVGSTAKTGSVAQDPLVEAFIGANPKPGDQVFDGRIDDVKIFGRGLTSSEVATEMAAPVAPPDVDTEAPTTPGSLSAVANGESSIDVAWTASTDDRFVATYVIARDGAEIATVPSSQLSYDDTALAPGSTHSYTVVAMDAAGNVSPAAGPVSATTASADTEAPSAPGSLNGTAISASQIALSWTAATDNVSIASYIVARDGTDVATLASSALSYTDAGLLSGTAYGYSVTAVDPSGNSATAGPITVTTAARPGGVVAAYDFSTSDSTVVDRSGNGNDGSLSGSAAIVAAGQFDDAVEFAGASPGSIDVGGFDVVGDQLTIAAWVNADDFGVADARIVSKATGTAADDHYWMLSTISGQRLRFRLKTDDGNATTTLIGTGGALTAGTWHFVAATYDGATMRLFIDGAEVGSTAKTGAIAVDNTVGVSIGTNPGSITKNFDGRIDELRIHTEALTGPDLETLALTPIGSPAADTEPPTTPGSLNAVAAGHDEVTLSWTESTDNVSVASYIIGRDGVEIVTLTAPAVIYADQSLDPATTYNYTVTAVDSSGNTAAAGPVSATTDPVLPDDLLLGYDFSGSGSTVTDVGANGNDGALIAPATRTAAGQFGDGLEIDGTGGTVDLGGLDVAGDQLTIAAWVNADDFGVYDARIVSKSTGTAADDHYWMLSTISGQRLRFRLKTDDGNATTTLIGTGGALTAGTWHFVAATYDGATMRLFIDGTEVGSTAKTGSVAVDASVDAWIGNNPGDPSQAFDGRIDEFRIHERALNATELQALAVVPVG